MKTSLPVLLIVLSLLTVSCDRRREPYQPLVPKANAAELGDPPAVSPAIEKAVRERGDRIAAEAFGVLSLRLGQAIADAGLTNAIEFCSVHGIASTEAVGVTNQVTLRRVTHRPRNPQNRADTNETALIRRFEAEFGTGTTPNPVVTAKVPGTATYYAPIVLKLPLCLTCHGQPETDIKPEVLAQIRKSYPADEAKGFALGQVRGLWRVDFKMSDFVKP